MTSGKKIFSSLLAGALAFAGVQATQAETVAWWRFDNGIGGAAVESTHEATVYQGGIPDYSGNGNVLLSFWDEDAPGNGTIYYDTEVPPVVSGGNVLSIRSQGSWPSMFTWSNESKPTLDLETIELREWTVEAFIKPGAVNGHRTIVGRDGAHNGGAAAVFYFFHSVLRSAIYRGA